nr:flippase [uncultured Pantoea sp.]
MLDKKLFKNIFSMFSIQGLNYLIPLVTIPYLVRVLGISEFGTYSLILAVIQYFVIFADYGFNLSASRQISINIKNIREVSKVFFSVIFCKIAIASLGFIILLISSIFYEVVHEHIFLFVMGYTIVIGTTFYPVWLFQGYEMMQWIAISNFIAKIIGVILVFTLVGSKQDIWIALLSQGIVGIFASVIALFKACQENLLVRIFPSYIDIKEQLRLGWNIFISSFFVSLYTTSVPIILGFTSGAESVGIYTAADKLKQGLQGLIGPVSQAVYPRSNRIMIESRERALRFVKNLGFILVTPIIILSFIATMMSNNIIDFAFGSGHSSSSIVFAIIIWIPPVVAIANLLGVQLLLPMGLSKKFSYCYIIVGLVGLPCLLIFSKLYSYVGVAYVALCVEIAIAILFAIILIFECKRFNKGRSDDTVINMHTNKK